MKNKGFTLLEILVAVAVFAIIASMTASILVRTLNTKDQSREQISKINNLQLVISLFTKDALQIAERPVRGNQMHLFPSFIGQHDYLEFTRSGNANPLAIEDRSSLIRIAYLCKDGKLIRRIWPQLDTPDRNDYHDTIMLKNLHKCNFQYVGMHNNLVASWYQYSVTKKNVSFATPLPKAIQVKLNIEKLGSMKLTFKT